MNKDIILGMLMGFILAVVLAGVGGFYLYSKAVPTSGLPGANQPGGSGSPPSPQQQPGSQTNGTLFGCPELKLVGTATVTSGVPFIVQNTDDQPHKINISVTEYDFSAEEKKTITVVGSGVYHPVCDGGKLGELNVGQ